MLSVILFILKLLGWILLILLGLFFVIIFTALFVPVYYRLNGEWFEQWKLFVNIRYLFFRMVIRFDTDEGCKKPTLKILMRVFGIPVRRRHRKTDKEATLKESQSTENQPDEVRQQDTLTAEPFVADNVSEGTENIDPEKQTVNDKKKRESKKKKQADEKKPSIGERITAFRSRIANKKNMEVLHLVLHEVLYLLRHFGPRKGTADVRFSMGDPANTGYVVGIVSICPFAYKKGLSICPDFITEEFYVKGTVSVRGHARLLHVLRSGIRLFINRDVRNLILRKS